MGKKPNWPALLVVSTLVFVVAAYFWIFGSVVHDSPLDEDNAMNMHLGGFEKLVQFDVPQFVSDDPTNFKATIKVIYFDFLFFKSRSKFEP